MFSKPRLFTGSSPARLPRRNRQREGGSYASYMSYRSHHVRTRAAACIRASVPLRPLPERAKDPPPPMVAKGGKTTMSAAEGVTYQAVILANLSAPLSNTTAHSLS